MHFFMTGAPQGIEGVLVGGVVTVCAVVEHGVVRSALSHAFYEHSHRCVLAGWLAGGGIIGYEAAHGRGRLSKPPM